ncbi:MAG: MarR family transcriptional regulator [Lachnospiraceae bacterium]|nr:MarR family transcriptional regulator [Lachnospiraceae bacterium]
MEHREELGHYIYTISNLLKREMDKGITEEGIDNLTGKNMWLIGYLIHCQEENIYQKDVEKHFALRRSTVSEVITLMEQKGLVQRLPSEKDARMKKLVLTEYAKKIYSHLCVQIKKTEDKMKEGFSEKEFDELLKYLKRVQDNIGAATVLKEKKEEN